MARVIRSTGLGSLVFFFQAEDGIRDVAVTGVQTCALPILGDPDVAVRDDRLVPSVGLRELSEVLDDEVRPDAVAGQVRERCLQEVEAPQRGKFIEHQEEAWTRRAPEPAAAGVESLREATPQLIEE